MRPAALLQCAARARQAARRALPSGGGFSQRGLSTWTRYQALLQGGGKTTCRTRPRRGKAQRHARHCVNPPLS